MNGNASLKHSRKAGLVALLLAACWTACSASAQNTGFAVLRAATTNLDGSGLSLCQAEAPAVYNSPPQFEPSYTNFQMQVSPTLITYYSSNGAANFYPNPVGTDYPHADEVGGYFYGVLGGEATNAAHVDVYEANYFLANIIDAQAAINNNDRIINQSFVDPNINDQTADDQDWDNYAAKFGTLFISGIGDGGTVLPPGTCYNGIGVGAYQGGSSVGPTPDNGRAKPDITAPEGATSYSTPQVSGAAAILLQAGLRGDGGADTNSAADFRTLKALLLNGAIKPLDWTNNPPSPLDPRYGSGVVNVYESYRQLAGGKHAYIANTQIGTGNAHPPPNNSENVPVLSGWDFNTNTSSAFDDSINHYFFEVTNSAARATFTATATLVWERQQNETSINQLYLYLYNTANNGLILSSTSTVDNVQHLFTTNLPQGRYDLQVLKTGGLPINGKNITNPETYALAFEFFPQPVMRVTSSGANIVISWPLYPAGFMPQYANSLTPPVTWSAQPVAVTFSNASVAVIPAGSSSQFFRLYRP